MRHECPQDDRVLPSVCGQRVSKSPTANIPSLPPSARTARAAMALSKLSGDEAGIVFVQLCNALEPRLAVYLSSTSHELRALTQALRQQLRADYEVAAALCRKVGMRSCKELREAKRVDWTAKALSADELATLGTLGSVLPALEVLHLDESAGAAPAASCGCF